MRTEGRSVAEGTAHETSSSSEEGREFVIASRGAEEPQVVVFYGGDEAKTSTSSTPTEVIAQVIVDIPDPSLPPFPARRSRPPSLPVSYFSRRASPNPDPENAIPLRQIFQASSQPAPADQPILDPTSAGATQQHSLLIPLHPQAPYQDHSPPLPLPLPLHFPQTQQLQPSSSKPSSAPNSPKQPHPADISSQPDDDTQVEPFSPSISEEFEILSPTVVARAASFMRFDDLRLDSAQSALQQYPILASLPSALVTVSDFKFYLVSKMSTWYANEELVELYSFNQLKAEEAQL